jgi:hypothetical protein
MTQEITLNLTIDEVSGVLMLLGKTQTEQGFYPLMVKVKEQAESQLGEKDGN